MTQKIAVLTTEDIKHIVNEAVVAAIKKKDINPKYPVKEIYSNKEAMKLLSVSRATLQRWRDKGSLQYHKINGSIYYKRRDIENLFESNNEEV